VQVELEAEDPRRLSPDVPHHYFPEYEMQGRWSRIPPTRRACPHRATADGAEAQAPARAARQRLRHDGSAHRVSGARQRSGGVEKYSSIASRQAPEHGSTANSSEPDSRITAATFSAQLMQTPARSIPQPVQLQLDL
jgi:hypothetical protein